MRSKVREAMFSDFEYDVAILGNDPAALQLAQRACCQFARVVLIEEAEFVSEDCVAGLTRLVGKVRFEPEHQIICETEQGSLSLTVQQIVIATGSTPVSPRWMIEHPQVVFKGSEHSLEQFDCLAIASKESVKLISGKDRILEEVIDSGIIGLSEEQGQIRIFLASGKSILVDAVVAAQVEQRGYTSSLNLEAVGLFADDRGCLWCNDNYETWTSGIYAVGNVVGYPSTECAIEKQIEIVMNSMLALRTASVCV